MMHYGTPVARDFVRWSVLIGVVATLFIVRIAGLNLSFAGIDPSLPSLIVPALLCPYIYRPPEVEWLNRLVLMIEGLGLLAIVSLLGAVATYPLAALSVGWVDKQLLAADALIGLNWLTYWNFVQTHPMIDDVLRYAYRSFMWSPMLLVICLGASGKRVELYRFLAAFIVGLAITDISFVFLPGKSAAEHFLPIGVPNAPIAGLLHIPIIDCLRNGSCPTIDVARMGGLVAFPSFHATAALLFAWTGWRIRWVRYPALILNVLMLVSAPIQGGHYFSDIVGGIVVGVVAIGVSGALRGTTSWQSFGQAPSTARMVDLIPMFYKCSLDGDSRINPHRHDPRQCSGVGEARVDGSRFADAGTCG